MIQSFFFIKIYVDFVKTFPILFYKLQWKISYIDNILFTTRLHKIVVIQWLQKWWIGAIPWLTESWIEK